LRGEQEHAIANAVQDAFSENIGRGKEK